MISVILIATIVIATTAGPPFSAQGSPSPEVLQSWNLPARTASQIQHIVVLMMENHAYDNFFGTYCRHTGPECPMTAGGLPPNTCVPYFPSDPAKGCIRPFAFTKANLSAPNLLHLYNNTIRSIANGSMNGFYQAENNSIEPFGSYNGSVLPIYWDIAQEFALGDRFFSSALSFTLPNHWDLLAGHVPTNGFNGSSLATNQSRHTYLNSANGTESVQDLLNLTPSVSWKYYDWSLLNYQSAINLVPKLKGSSPEGSAYNLLSPLAAKYESYSNYYVSHFVPRSTLFADASSGNLPNVSWVIPGPTFSDHPPVNLTKGEGFVASVVNAIESSPDWKSTALFITWDDYGGFYDHIAPPKIDPLGLSIRVPLLVVSPYTPVGLVVHQHGYFESLLHFIEWRFHLGCITSRDCLAPLPLGFFNFTAPPRSGILFPTDPANATYPVPDVSYVPPIWASTSAFACGIFCINPTAWNAGPTGPPPDEATAD